MKNLFVILSVLTLSATSYACPNLSGDWVCKDDKNAVSRLKVKSINTIEISYLEVVSSNGGASQHQFYALDVGRQHNKNTSYVATCGSGSVAIAQASRNGEKKSSAQTYTLEGGGMTVLSSDSEGNIKYASCRKLSIHD